MSARSHDPAGPSARLCGGARSAGPGVGPEYRLPACCRTGSFPCGAERWRVSEQLILFGPLDSDLRLVWDAGCTGLDSAQQPEHGPPFDPSEPFASLDCRRDTTALGEYYMVRDRIWLRVNPREKGMLCIGCVEERLGRRLAPTDFTDAPVNTSREYTREHSPRLRLRLQGAA